MTQLEQLFERYAADHRNPVNKLLHWICIPAILFSAFGLLAVVRLGDAGNLATLALLLALFYYFRLSWRAGVLMIPPLGALIGLAMKANEVWGSNAIALHAAIFFLAWAGQFIGHKIEGRKPSFFEDLRFTLIGPAWLWYLAFSPLRREALWGFGR